VNPYFDPVSRVKYKRLGIGDAGILQIGEYRISGIRIQHLALAPIHGVVGVAHWSAIHRHICQDVYDWAGKLSTANPSKLDPVETGWRLRFASHHRIPELAQQTVFEIERSDRLNGLIQADLVAGIAGILYKTTFISSASATVLTRQESCGRLCWVVITREFRMTQWVTRKLRKIGLIEAPVSIFSNPRLSRLPAVNHPIRVVAMG
jgi:hypothetical protein